jgi:hypothetical protein
LIEDAGDPPAAPSERPELAFARKHRLTSVLIHGPQGMILVDNQTLRTGEAFDGARLVLVTPEKAVFEYADVRIELKLDPEAAP